MTVCAGQLSNITITRPAPAAGGHLCRPGEHTLPPGGLGRLQSDDRLIAVIASLNTTRHSAGHHPPLAPPGSGQTRTVVYNIADFI